MVLVEFSYPAAEAQNTATGQDMYEAVVDVKNVQKENSKPTEGVDSSRLPVVVRSPTHKEALQAAWALQKYIEVIDDPFARMLEGCVWAEDTCTGDAEYEES